MNKIYKIISLFTFLFFIGIGGIIAQPCSSNADCTKANKPFCGFNGNDPEGNCQSEDPLPVEFIYFQAFPDSKFVKLMWATATELNNAFFSVEYSRDGVGYKEIGRVAGNGNSIQTITYEFMHETPLVGENYYRLRQEDFDGTFEYSDIVVVNKDGDQAVSIRPNTVIGEMTVVVSKGFEKDTDGIVYDLLGSEVMTVRFPANTSQQSFDVSQLPSGHYFFRVQEGASLVTVRFVKTD